MRNNKKTPTRNSLGLTSVDCAWAHLRDGTQQIRRVAPIPRGYGASDDFGIRLAELRALLQLACVQRQELLARLEARRRERTTQPLRHKRA